eukprot:scaffold2696_cov48-Isochrysis_galbana.AAC.1
MHPLPKRQHGAHQRLGLGTELELHTRLRALWPRQPLQPPPVLAPALPRHPLSPPASRPRPRLVPAFDHARVPAFGHAHFATLPPTRRLTRERCPPVHLRLGVLALFMRHDGNVTPARESHRRAFTPFGSGLGQRAGVGCFGLG